MLFGSGPDMGVDMKYSKTQNVIRLATAFALAVSVTQASLSADGNVARGNSPATALSVQALQADALVGGQASDVNLYICAALVLMSPFFPLAIIPAVPVCYNAYTSTLG